MHPEKNPAEALFDESQRLEVFVNFWGQRVEIEKAYLDNLSRLRIPDPPGNGQLQELAQKTRGLLLDELEERTRGFAKLSAAHKALTDAFRTEEGPSHFDLWGGAIKQSLLRMDSLAAEVATAESLAERLAAEAREEDPTVSSSAKKKIQPRSNVLTRLLDKARNEKPRDTPSFLSADSTYRQNVQKLNDEKYVIQNAIVPQTVLYVEQERKCVVALKHIVSVFSAVHSDLAQVLNITPSQLCIVSSSVDASMESASFAERLEGIFTPLISLYRYTSYGISSSLRPTTMLFGCPLPDELDDSRIGQRAVSKAFEAILSSAAKKHPVTLYDAICDRHKRQGYDIELSALQLESLWDPSQLDGGLGAIYYLARVPSVGLLVYFLMHLPEPFLPLPDQVVRRLSSAVDPVNMRDAIIRTGSMMGTARRCNLVRLLLTLQHHQYDLSSAVLSCPTGPDILIRPSNLLAPYFIHAFAFLLPLRGTQSLISGFRGDNLLLPQAFIEELKDAGLLRLL